MSGIYIRFPHAGTSFGGVDRVNNAIAEVVSRNFEVVDSSDDACLQLCSHQWNVPPRPRRIFVDHGSFSDAGFWAYSAPMLRREDTILVSSQVCEAIADRMLGDRRPDLRRIPLFVDTSAFHPAEDRQVLRAGLASRGVVPGDGPLLIGVSAYSRQKNLHLAINLLREVRSRVPDARLALVGTPNKSQQPYRAYLEKLIREDNLAGCVHLVPRMSYVQLAELMRASDAFVHLTTCRIENFGLVVAEALACGLPVLAADWGGLRDLVQHGKRGYLAPTWLTSRGPRVDWRGLVSSAVSLLTDSALRERLSRDAADFARAGLGLDLFERRYCETIEGVLGGHRGPTGPVSLSALGQELMFSTIQLHRKRPDIGRTSEEYQAMLAEHPELCRSLIGPAASSEQPPRAAPGVRAYRVVPVEDDGQTIHVTDPSWAERLKLSAQQRLLVSSADGRPLSEIAADLQLSVESACESAQWLFDRGVLGSMVEV